jgi:hypothetical protein
LTEYYEFAVKSLGLDPVGAWDYTPYEICLIAENYAFEAKEELKRNITQAYYTEYFARHKKLPKLSKVLKDIDKPQKQTMSKGDMVLKAMAREKGVIM